MTGKLYWYYNLCVVWLGSFWTYVKCQKPVAVRYWYGAWRHGASCQAVESKISGSGHYRCEAPGGKVESARRWRCSEGFCWRLAVCDACQVVWTRFRLAAWDARQAVLVQWWCTRKSFYIALGDVHDARLWLGA